MSLPQDLRHLFLEWMQVEYTIKSQAKSKIAYTYSNAIKSLKQFPTAIQHPQQLIDLKYFGTGIVQTIHDKLISYCDEFGYDFPELPESLKEKQREKDRKDKEKAEKAAKNNNKKKRKDNDSDNENNEDNDDNTSRPSKKTKKSTNKAYVPKVRSGAYAIMLALLLHDKSDNGMTKNEIIKKATIYCNSSFQGNASTGNFYSAWNSVKTLIGNEYVVEFGNPHYYSLTPQGKKVAIQLEKLELINPSSKIHSVNQDLSSSRDTSFVEQSNRNIVRNPLASSSPNISRNIQKLTPIKGGTIDEIMKKQSNLTTLSSPSSLRSVTDLIGNVNNTSKSDCEIWKPGSYALKFILDNREVFSKQDRDVFSKTLKDKGINAETRALPVGDGLWVAINKKTKLVCALDFIFERKRLDDFAGSIVDGRFREQKSRLQRSGMKRIFYIVEEQTSSDVSKAAEAIKTSISMNTTYSNFHTIRTKDPSETITFINELHNVIKKYYKNKSLLVLKPRDLNTQHDYNQILKAVRKAETDKEVVYSFDTFNEILGKSAMVTVGEMFIRLLMTIRGVSLDKACAIQQHFGTVRNLIERYEIEHSSSHCAKLIAKTLEIEIGARKVGHALSSKIAVVFCKGCSSIK